MKKVMVFGTFDILHCGHIHMFQDAKEYGDELIVVIGRDKNVEIVKGVGPLHNEEERLSLLKHIDIINKVRLGDKEDVYKVIREEKPDIIALGYDQKVYVDKLEDAIGQSGLSIKIVRLKPYHQEKYKSSKIKKFIERFV